MFVNKNDPIENEDQHKNQMLKIDYQSSFQIK